MKSNTFTKKLYGKGLRIAIVRARFNEKITAGLLRGCLEGLRECAVQKKDIKVVEVPGSFEIPFAASLLAKSGKYDVIIALGAVIKGETKHDEYIANAVAQGITNASIEKDVPIIFGVITPNNFEQAMVRSRDDKLNKGREAAFAAIEMGLLVRKIRVLWKSFGSRTVALDEKLDAMESRILSHVDGFIKLHQTLVLELAALRSKNERLEERLKKVEMKLGIAVEA